MLGLHLKASDILLHMLATCVDCSIFSSLQALWARRHVPRALHRMNIEAMVTARYMAGVVEVDLPVFELQPLARNDDRYWQKREPCEGTSWGNYHWFRTEQDQVCIPPHMNPKLSLPKSRISFEKLIVFLQDRGASLMMEGFLALRKCGLEAPVGTILMGINTPGMDTEVIPVLTVAEPGERHGSIPLKLHYNEMGRNFRSPPLSWIKIPAARESAVSSALTSAPYSRGTSPRVSSDNSPRQHPFYIQIGIEGVESIFGTGDTPSDIRISLDHDHLKLQRVADVHWESWLACAAIALFGYKDMKNFRYQPSIRVLDFAIEGDFPVRAAFHLNQIHHLSKKGESSLPSQDNITEGSR